MTKTICHVHDRPAYLWGGDICDLCDKDGNGAADALEGVGVGPNPENHSLFALAEKGYRIIEGGSIGRIPHNDPQKRINESARKLRETGLASYVIGDDPMKHRAEYWQKYRQRIYLTI